MVLHKAVRMYVHLLRISNVESEKWFESPYTSRGVERVSRDRMTLNTAFLEPDVPRKASSLDVRKCCENGAAASDPRVFGATHVPRWIHIRSQIEVRRNFPEYYVSHRTCSSWLTNLEKPCKLLTCRDPAGDDCLQRKNYWNFWSQNSKPEKFH